MTVEKTVKKWSSILAYVSYYCSMPVMENLSAHETPGVVEKETEAWEEKIEVSNLKTQPPFDAQSKASSTAPDGGLWGWLRVLAAWLLFIAAWGPAVAFGTFEDFYTRNYLANESPSNISWIGSVSTTLLIVSGAIAGPLFDRGYLKPIMVIASFLIVLSFMMLSLSTTYYQILLSQGICYGLGAGLVFVPGLAFVINSHVKWRAIAVGLTSSGASIGGVIFPILFRNLEPSIGFPWTCRVIGFTQLTLVLAGLAILAQAPTRKTKPRKLLEMHAFRSLTFDVYFVIQFCIFLAYWVPLFYVPTFAIDALGSSQDFASYYVVFINAASAFGRILPSLIVHKIGAPLVTFVCTSIAAILLFAWIAVNSTVGFVVWCVLYGFFTGVFISVVPLVVAHPIITPSLDRVGTRIGMLFFAGGVGALIGNPIAGVILNPKTKDFLGVQVFGASLMLVAAVGMFYIYLVHRRYEQKRLSDNN